MELPADANETFGTTRFYYLTYKIASAFSIYALPIVTRVGVVGNTISMCVMFQRNNRKHSFGSYLGPPAVSTTSVVCISTAYRLVCLLHSKPLRDIACRIRGWLINSLQMIGLLFILTVTYDRVIAVRLPLKPERLPHLNMLTTPFLSIQLMIVLDE